MSLHRVVIVGQAPELVRYVRFLLSRLPEQPQVWTARDEVAGFFMAADHAADLVVVDEDLPLMQAGEFLDLLAKAPQTRETRLLLLSAGDASVPLPAGRLGTLAKPFRPRDFETAVHAAPAAPPRPRGERLRAKASAWSSRLSLDRYTAGEAAAAAALLAGIVWSAARRIAPGEGLVQAGPDLLLWGLLLLLVSFAGHLAGPRLRRPALLFAQFAWLVSILPPGAVQVAQSSLGA